MKDLSGQVFHAEPERLARLLASPDSSDGHWRAREMAAILRHQLKAPIGGEPGPPLAPNAPSPQAAPGTRSIQELLTDPNPALPLLTQVKKFAKLNLEIAESYLPRDVALVLYYAAIVAAWLRCRERITKLSDIELRDGIIWALSQPWLSEELRRLFEEGKTALG